MTSRPGLRGRLALVASVITFAVAYIAHASMIHAYGVEVPFWDQWAAEGALVLKPWAEGTLTWSSMLGPWNEHRIFFSRLVTLAMYEMAGERWAVMPTEYVNAAIYALTPAFLVAFVARSGAPRKQKALMALAIIIFSVLPHGWENTLGAFQNQFYFMLLVTVAGLGLAAFGRPTLATSLTLIVLAMLSDLIMAPAILTGPAVAVVLLARAWSGSLSWRRALGCSAILLAVFVGSYLTTAKVAGHTALHAQTMHEAVHVAMLVASWPTVSPAIGAVVLWIPSIAGFWMICRRRWTDPFDLMMLGAATWVAAQIVGIALSRGHDMLVVTPRYTDVLALGVLANIWFAVRLAGFATDGNTRLAARIPLILLSLLVTRGYIATWDSTQEQMANRRDLSLMFQTHVHAYLETGLAEELVQPPSMLPLPDGAVLKQLLDDSTIHKMLVGPAQVANKEPGHASGNK